DNNFLTECQNAANEAMIKVCGDTENCNGLAVDDNIGARSLEYKICEYNGASDDDDITYESANCRVDADAVTENDYRNNVPLAGILSGIIFWEEVEFDENGNLEDVDTYLKKTGLNLNDSERQFIKSELGTLQTSINNAAQAIEADPTVQYCMTGRTVQGMRKNATQAEETSPRQDFGDGTGRFPQLTKQMRMTIATAALQLAKENYYEKYDELNEKMLEDFKKVGQKVAELQAEDNKNARREPSRRACIQLARNSTAVVAIPQSTTNDGEEIGSTAIKNGTVIMPYTSGNSNLAAIDDVKNHIIGLKMTGYSKSQSLSLIREVSTTFNWDTLVCHKCVINTTCGKVKKKFLGSRYCKYWNEPKETCEDIQF
ncbi:MAG: hypothetical protein IJX89_00935, partial [Alphaproteobacteria bacterium]|nr:hypothetical protein [Alphaproteobacteria bacterium]